MRAAPTQKSAIASAETTHLLPPPTAVDPIHNRGTKRRRARHCAPGRSTRTVDRRRYDRTRMPLRETAFVDAVIDWYRASARVLPWRQTRDPYAILVSEIMLQQTQVSRVVERYNEWLARWPTAAALAAATPGEAIAAWSGLGYNNRAVRLHAAARQVARDGWPQTYEGLLALPGVGPYTAAARQLPGVRRGPPARRRQHPPRPAPRARAGDDRAARRPHARADAGAVRPRRHGLHRPAPALRRLPAGRATARRAGGHTSRSASRAASRARGGRPAVHCCAAWRPERSRSTTPIADIAVALARDGLVSIADGRITLPGE